MPGYEWNQRRTYIWALHIAGVAPLLVYFRHNATVLLTILAVSAVYHAVRLFTEHGCKDSYAELNVFHLVFSLPLIAYCVLYCPSALVPLAVLTAVYFLAKFALYRACVPAKTPAPRV